MNLCKRSLYKNLKSFEQPKQVFPSKNIVFFASKKEPIFSAYVLECEKSKHCNGSIQSSQLARFFKYKTELQNKQYNFKTPQVESHDV